MSVDVPRRTFPKKASPFNFKEGVHKKRFREASLGGNILTRKHHRFFVAGLSEHDGHVAKNGKRKVANGLKSAKNGKPANVASKKKTKKKTSRGEPVKGTSIDHRMLGGTDDELYASEDDVVDVTDMLDDDDDITVIPMANSQKASISPAAEEKSDSKRSSVRVIANKESSEDEVNSGEEEVVEFSTGRGSSKLDLSSDSDDEEKPGPLEKTTEAIEDDTEGDFGGGVRQNGTASRKIRGKETVETMDVLDDYRAQEQGAEGEDDEEDEEEIVAAFRAELADLPLGKVREMREKLGLKLFNKAYFGATDAGKKAEETRKKKLEAKRAEYHGQHRPKEISSKKPVSAFRPIYQENVGKKKRDPRFDSRAGLFKERCFDDNYRFLEELKRQEKEELTKEAVACVERGDTETAEKIRETIRRMENRERTKADRKMKEETLRELREANIERMMHGERPVFKTKAQVKMMNLEKKYKQLKKDNKLDKYMKRKAKKEAHKDVKNKPTFEEMYGYQ